MASGDPPVTGNPVDVSGMFTIKAQPSGNSDNTLTVSITDNRKLELFLKTGINGEEFTFLLNKESWFMEIRERD
ncbi:MAG TPA: hypothetical protein VFI24_20345 [Pyrinomonadaceae bacterium]|nr:hypothetical protein [Pyrinomonadaceae bacterium]